MAYGQRRETWPCRPVLTVLAILAWGVPANAATRAVFVGINQYSHSHQHDPSVDPGFHDLDAAVGDVVTIKRALAKATGLAFDPGPLTTSNQCDPSNDVSITLTDACATRAAILAALSHQIAASKPGDLVFFYFAGLSSRYAGAPSGSGQTLTPSDATRGPGASGDIPRDEIEGYVSQALRRGVSVSMMIDTCLPDKPWPNDRFAPAIAGPTPAPTAPPPLPQPDGSAAGAFRAGFESGCAQAPVEDSNGLTFSGLLTDEATWAGQGDLRPADLIAAKPWPAQRLAARVTDRRTITIAKPDPAHVTVGSIYAVYPIASAVTPLGQGIVTSVGPDQAIVTLDTPLPAEPPDVTAVMMSELAHDFGVTKLEQPPSPPAMIGGLPVKDGEAPWMVELQYRPPFKPGFKPTLLKLHACGGALIDYYWVVTAAHCVPKTLAGLPDADGAPRRLIVRVGSVDLSHGMVSIPIDRVFVHPKFCDADARPAPGVPAPHCAITINDIALFHLTQKAPDAYQGRFPMAELPRAVDDIRADRPISAMGWGALSNALAARGVMEPKLQVAALAVAPPETCRSANAPYNPAGFARPMAPSLLCADSPGYKRDVCKGDSGGPLLSGRYDQYDNPTLIGVVSFGAACAHAPAVFTRVSAFRGWITTVIISAKPPP